MKQIQLFGTLACHLCEQAQEILREFEQKGQISLIHCDIVDEPQWLELYRIRIPVVAYGDQELGWPFDAETVASWLKKLDAK